MAPLPAPTAQVDGRSRRRPRRGDGIRRVRGAAKGGNPSLEETGPSDGIRRKPDFVGRAGPESQRWIGVPECGTPR
jgi:hypothetical protein